jgi:hypothetical protein
MNINELGYIYKRNPHHNGEDFRVVAGAGLFYDPERGGLINEASVSLRSPVSFIFTRSPANAFAAHLKKIKALMLRIKALL